MKRLIAALATTAALLVPASGAQAATFIYPTLFPTATMFSMGWQAFPSGDPAAMLDNSRAVGFETPALNQGVQGGLSMTAQVEHFALPPEATIREWSVHLYAQAGTPIEPGEVEARIYSAAGGPPGEYNGGVATSYPVAHTTVSDGPGWAVGTAPAEAPGWSQSFAWCSYEHWGWEGKNCVTWQQALDGAWLEIRLKKWSKANRAYEVYLQPKVEVP